MDTVYSVIGQLLWHTYGHALPDSPGMMAIKIEKELKNKGFLKEENESPRTVGESSSAS